MERLWGSGSERAHVHGSAAAPARRRARFARRRPSSAVLDALMADLSRLGETIAAPCGPDEAVDDLAAGVAHDIVDEAERALLIQLYRELVATVDGPLVPFPTELVVDPAHVAEREEPAELVDLDRFRQQRAAAAAADADGAGEGDPAD